ncbi:hypothetical protein CANDROIZ_100010 [Candidatus Roizmanbacteria bacterium]|nr:hypothetical protein CANDROIZ_100010 [Candidatus Roizmanbacteria bacterium]
MIVIPVKTGIQTIITFYKTNNEYLAWIPAYAGMTPFYDNKEIFSRRITG